MRLARLSVMAARAAVLEARARWHSRQIDRHMCALRSIREDGRRLSSTNEKAAPPTVR